MSAARPPQRRRGTGESLPAPAQSGPPARPLLADPKWQLLFLLSVLTHEEGKSVIGSGLEAGSRRLSGVQGQSLLLGRCHSALVSPPSPSGHQDGGAVWAALPTGDYGVRLRAWETYLPFPA